MSRPNVCIARRACNTVFSTQVSITVVGITDDGQSWSHTICLQNEHVFIRNSKFGANVTVAIWSNLYLINYFLPNIFFNYDMYGAWAGCSRCALMHGPLNYMRFMVDDIVKNKCKIIPDADS